MPPLICYPLRMPRDLRRLGTSLRGATDDSDKAISDAATSAPRSPVWAPRDSVDSDPHVLHLSRLTIAVSDIASVVGEVGEMPRRSSLARREVPLIAWRQSLYRALATTAPSWPSPTTHPGECTRSCSTPVIEAGPRKAVSRPTRAGSTSCPRSPLLTRSIPTLALAVRPMT
jgi:hypothetical protein